MPSIYFSHERDVFERDGSIYAVSGYVQVRPDEQIMRRKVRFRTVGDMTCTGAIFSEAADLEEVIAEIRSATTTERGTRIDDRRSDNAMEERKRSGYF